MQTWLYFSVDKNLVTCTSHDSNHYGIVFMVVFLSYSVFFLALTIFSLLSTAVQIPLSVIVGYFSKVIFCIIFLSQFQPLQVIALLVGTRQFYA